MVNEQGYREIIEKIVNSKVKTFGILAINKIMSIDGLRISDDGKVVNISGQPKKIIQDLLDIFELMAGKASTYSVKIAIRELKDKYHDVELPQELA